MIFSGSIKQAISITTLYFDADYGMATIHVDG